MLNVLVLINNFGARYANGEVFLFLNNDTEVITPDWIQEMLMHALRKEIGCVGAKLYDQDKNIQHAGIVVGMVWHNWFYRHRDKSLVLLLLVFLFVPDAVLKLLWKIE